MEGLMRWHIQFCLWGFSRKSTMNSWAFGAPGPKATKRQGSDADENTLKLKSCFHLPPVSMVCCRLRCMRLFDCGCLSTSCTDIPRANNTAVRAVLVWHTCLLVDDIFYIHSHSHLRKKFNSSHFQGKLEFPCLFYLNIFWRFGHKGVICPVLFLMWMCQILNTEMNQVLAWRMMRKNVMFIFCLPILCRIANFPRLETTSASPFVYGTDLVCHWNSFDQLRTVSQFCR